MKMRMGYRAYLIIAEGAGQRDGTVPLCEKPKAHNHYNLRGSLDTHPWDRYRRYMAESILTFDFGTNEEGAQQARHKIEGWKQGFRLGGKMVLKFEREHDGASKGQSSKKEVTPKKSAGKAEGEDETKSSGRVRLLVRLNFSDHEKLSHQRWLDRIPAEEPFKSVKTETVRTGDREFPNVAELFDSLD